MHVLGLTALRHPLGGRYLSNVLSSAIRNLIGTGGEHGHSPLWLYSARTPKGDPAGWAALHQSLLFQRRAQGGFVQKRFPIPPRIAYVLSSHTYPCLVDLCALSMASMHTAWGSFSYRTSASFASRVAMARSSSAFRGSHLPAANILSPWSRSNDLS